MTGRCTGGYHHAPTTGGACPCGAVSRHPVAVRDRYAQCADDCTTDCGACKGAGRPAAPDCRCGHAQDRHLRHVQEHQDACAGGTPGFCGCSGYTPAAPDATAGDGLREVLRHHHPIMRSETGPFSGCRCGAVKLGQDVIEHVVTELRRALDGTT